MELLVVVAIMAILLAVIMVSVSSSRQKGRDAKRINDMRSLSNALELYRSANNFYPPGVAGGGAASVALSALTPNFISTIPKDPSGTDYWYTGLTGTISCTGYHLGASMETNNSVLASDADFVSTAPGLRCPAGSFGISGVETGGAFSGRCRNTDPLGSLCYDVINKQ